VYSVPWLLCRGTTKKACMGQPKVGCWNAQELKHFSTSERRMKTKGFRWTTKSSGDKERSFIGSWGELESKGPAGQSQSNRKSVLSKHPKTITEIRAGWFVKI